MPNDARRALRFVLLMGVVNLFADMTYEGGRGVVGAFLGHLGANGVAIGAVAGGGELAGYAIRSVSGAVADRTGKYWLDAWVGYLLNMLCVPALSLAGSWPAAAGLVIGERLGRGIRRPVIAAVLSEAGASIGGGHAFGLNEALDQIGATLGPLVVALAIARSGSFAFGFAVLLIPALLTLASLTAATTAGRAIVPRAQTDEPAVRDWPGFRRNVLGGALVAAGSVDFALIAFRFQRDHVLDAAAISVWFAVAMAVAAVASPILGRLFDRLGTPVIGVALVITSAATPLAFFGRGATAEAGSALWGVGTALQDALLLALIATNLNRRKRATLFGVYDLVFGTAWFVGSLICGFLVDRSITGLVVFSVALQLLAIPSFVATRR
jgi:hypothetical protein